MQCEHYQTFKRQSGCNGVLLKPDDRISIFQIQPFNQQ